MLGEVACPAIRDLIVITPDLAFLNSFHLRGRLLEPPYLMPDVESYQRDLLHRSGVDFDACLDAYLEPVALETPRRPLSAARRLALIDEGAERGYLDQPTDATLSAIEHGTPHALASEAGADLRKQYAILPGAINFLGVHDYSRFTED